MKTTNKIIFSILVILVLGGNKTYSQEMRGGVGLEYAPSKLSIDIEFDTRRTSVFNDEHKYVGEIKFTYPVLDHISLSGSFRYFKETEYEYEENVQSLETECNNRFAFDVRYKSERFENDLRLTNRLRYQFGHEHGEIDNSSLRDKIGIDYKMSKIYSPYLATEIYYNPEDERVKVYRFYLGNSLEIGKTEIDLFYIIEKKLKKINTESYYILGLSLKYRI